MNNLSPQCANCYFAFKSDTEMNTYTCHNKPPSIISVPIPTNGGVTIQVRAVFPPVPENEWCGEFTEKISKVLNN